MKNPQQMTETILCSIREAGVRAIVSKGWSKLGAGYSDENVIFIDDCPHGELHLLLVGQFLPTNGIQNGFSSMSRQLSTMVVQVQLLVGSDMVARLR